jgi:hypothetical protein
VLNGDAYQLVAHLPKAEDNGIGVKIPLTGEMTVLPAFGEPASCIISAIPKPS